VKDHFGSAESPGKDFGKVDAYWNIDDGTGRVRGASIFGPPQAAAILAQYLKPFDDWGVYGATASTARVEGGSDNGAFAVAGLPGIGMQQDPIEYNSTTWHTNLDTYERIVPEDVMHNAVVTASVMWGLANRDEMLPRFAPGEMPAVPAGRGGGRGAAPTGPVALPHVYALGKGKALSVRAPGLVEVGGRGGASAPTLTATIVMKPAHGKLAVNPDGSFTYTPSAAFTGADSFTYTVAAGGATSEPATVTFVIK
jgi:hypothetical protein